MDYQSQSITIKTRQEGDVQFEALVAAGTGLAYHRNYAGQGKFFKTYNVTHLLSGCSLCRDQFDNPEAVKRFIELVAPLTDWSQSREVLRSRELEAALYEAYNKAQEFSLERRGAEDN